MMPAFAILASFAWATLGFLLLALTIDRHRLDVFGRDSKAPGSGYFWRLQTTGWAGLLLSLIAAAVYKGWAVGAVVWCGVLAVVAFSLMLLLSYKPLWVMRALLLSLVTGVGSFGLAFMG